MDSGFKGEANLGHGRSSYTFETWNKTNNRLYVKE